MNSLNYHQIKIDFYYLKISFSETYQILYSPFICLPSLTALFKMELKEQLDLMQRMLMLQTTMMMKDYFDRHGISVQNQISQDRSETFTSQNLPALPETEEDSESSGKKSNSNSLEDSEELDANSSTSPKSSPGDLIVTLPVPYSRNNPWGLSSLEGIQKDEENSKSPIPRNKQISDLPSGHIHQKYPLCGDMKIALIGAHGTGKTSYLKTLLKLSFEQNRYEPGHLGSHRFSIVVDFPGRYDQSGTLKSIRRKRIFLTIVDYPGQRNISVDKTIDGVLLFGTSCQDFSETTSNKIYQRVISQSDLLDEREIPSKTKLSRMKNPPIYISSVTQVNLLVPLEKMIESRFGKLYQIYHPIKIE